MGPGPDDIHVDKSTLFSKYSDRFKIFNIYRFVVNALNYCAMLLVNNIGNKHFYKIIFDLIVYFD